MPEAEIESLATALAHLQDEKRRCNAEEAKSQEALARRRDRYDRESQLLSRINDELSKSREAFEATKIKTESTLEKMNAARQANEALKREIDAAEAEMEERRRRRHDDAATKAKDAEALMEEMKRKREETNKEKAREAKQKIEREMSGQGGEGSGFPRMTEEIRKFEEDELMREQNRGRMKITDAAMEEALDAIDALESGAAAWNKEEAVMEELSGKAERVISGLTGNDEDDDRR